MKRYQITLDGQAFDVLLLSDPQQAQVQVEVDGIAFTAEVKDFTAEPDRRRGTLSKILHPPRPRHPYHRPALRPLHQRVTLSPPHFRA